MSAPTGVLISADHLECLARDHGLTIELDRQCAFAIHRGNVYFAPLQPAGGAR